MLGLDPEFLKLLNEQNEVVPQDDTWKWIIFLMFWPGIPLLLLAVFCLEGCRSSQNHAPAINQEANELDESEEDEEVIADIDIPNESINETRLASVGIDQYQVRDHRTLGFFYDPTTMGIIDNPVVLNTGDILDENTAEQLVRNRSNLPRGRATGFFRSPQLSNLLNTLIDEEVERRVNNQ